MSETERYNCSVCGASSESSHGWALCTNEDNYCPACVARAIRFGASEPAVNVYTMGTNPARLAEEIDRVLADDLPRTTEAIKLATRALLHRSEQALASAGWHDIRGARLAAEAATACGAYLEHLDDLARPKRS